MESGTPSAYKGCCVQKTHGVARKVLNCAKIFAGKSLFAPNILPKKSKSMSKKENPSWGKQAAAAGIEGMTLEEAVDRAMSDPTFQ